MAQRTTVELVDDLDGTEASQTVEFGLDGAAYEIDLSSEHADALREALARFLASARRTGRRRSTSGSSSPKSAASGQVDAGTASREQNQAVRAWASRHGYAVSARGRIPAAVTTAYLGNDPSALPPGADGGSAPSTEPAPDPDAPVLRSRAGVQKKVGTQKAGDEKAGADGLTRMEREHIRSWALEQGIEVKARGRLTTDLIGNYRAAEARASR